MASLHKLRIAVIAMADTYTDCDFASATTKYLHNIIDRPAIDYPLRTGLDMGAEVFLVSPHIQLKSVSERLACDFMTPEDAHVYLAKLGEEPLLIIPADIPSISSKSLSHLWEFHANSNSPLTYYTSDQHNEKYSPYITSANKFAPLSSLIKEYPGTTPAKWYPSAPQALSTRSCLATIIGNLQAQINHSHMQRGITIINPSTTYIGLDAAIEQDTVIFPNTWITGSTAIASGAVIGCNSRLHNCIVGQGSSVEYSVLVDAKIGDATSVGPFAYLRPGSVVGEGCRIGNFVEIKNSTLGDSSKAPHLAYIGDSIVGRNVNLGCGIITANYDGKTKHKTLIDDDAFIGSNANLVAPIQIGKGAFVAAGSTITKNVEPGALAIARAKQDTKPGYAEKLKNKPAKS